MQNAFLPSLNASTSPKSTQASLAASQAKADLGAGGANDAFKQALSQQLDQRQSARNAEARSAATRNAEARNAEARTTEARAAERQAASRAADARPQAAARPAQQDKAADRRAEVKPAEQQAAAASGTGGASQAGSDDDSNHDAAQQAGAGQPADPMTAMLALVAAYNQRVDGGAAQTASDAAAAVAGGEHGSAAGASKAVDAATLAALTAAEASTGATADGADAPAMTDADFKAALGRAADALHAPATGSDADAGSSLTSLRAELAQQAAKEPHDGKASGVTPAAGAKAAGVGAATSASASATAAAGDAAALAGNAPGANAVPPADTGKFGQHLAAATAGGDARADSDAALAAKEATAATVSPAHAQAAGAAAAPEVARVAAPATTLYSRVGTPAWDQQLGQKVIFMAAGGEHSATMELNPPDLGPLQVVLSVNKDQATAAFTAAAPEVRQALEAALPRLREMMGDAGIMLGNATVSSGEQGASARMAQDNGRNDQRGRSSLGSGNDGSGEIGGVSAAATTRTVRLDNGAVDTFA